MSIRGRARAAAVLAAFVVGGYASEARAQVYLTTEQAQTFTPIATIPGITNVTPVTFTSRDEGVTTITLPFGFVYLGRTMTSAELGVNGFLHFGNQSPGYINDPVGSASSENDTIFMWWDDLILPATTGYADYGTIGNAPNRIFVIEVRDLEHFSYSTRPELRYQVWLFEGGTGRFEIHYDGVATAAENYSATVGYEGPNGDGDPFGAFRPCATASPYCDEVDFASLAGRRVAVEQAVGPELIGAVGVFGRGALPGGAATGDVTVQNVGTVDVTNVQSALYLSTDTVRDAQDIQVGAFTVAQLSAGGAPVTRTATITVPAQTPPGNYYLLMAVDAPNAIAEAEEDNNVVAAAARFATAYELRAVSVVAQTGGNAGDTVAFDVVVENLGVPYVGALGLELRASANTTYVPAMDPQLDTFTVNMTGAPSQAFTLPVTLPALAPSDYYPVLIVDPLDNLLEYDETNQTLVGPQPFPSGPDFVATAAVVPAGAAPLNPISFDLTIANQGVAYSGPLTIRVQASVDPIFDVNDPVLGTTTVSLNGLPSEQVVVTVTLPNLPPGQWFPLFTLDPGGAVAEIRDFNNRFVAATTFASGPNFTVQDIAADTEASTGQPFTVTTRIGSVGAPYTGAVGYRLLLSQDRVLDAQDVLLGTYTVNFSGQAFLDDTRSPGYPSVPPVAHYVIAQVDPQAAIGEANENDNVLADDDDVLSGPDLTVASPNFTPTTIAPGDPIMVTATLEVSGSPYSGPVAYRVVLSEDTTIEASDPEIYRGMVTVSGIGDTAIAVTARPTGVRPDRYYVYVEVDPDDLVFERNENNNRRTNFSRLEILGPNLVPTIAQAGPIAFRGRPYTIALDIANNDAADSGTFRYAYYLTRNGILLSGTRIFVSPPVSVAQQTTTRFVDDIVLPVSTATGAVQIGVFVDHEDLVPETDEGDNIAVIGGSILVSDLVPDLVAQLIGTATAAAAGEELALTRVLGNIGVADAPAFEYGYYASTDATLTSADILLATRTSSLAEGDSTYGIDVIDIPATVPAGTYYVGIVVNPTRAVAEIDYTNNASIPVRIPIYDAALRVFTEAIPDPRFGVPYEAGLFAVGGTADHVWTIARGALPAGLQLDAATGLISGVASAEGPFTFTARVSSGVAFAERTFRGQVRSATVPLMVASGRLPTAVVGAPYDAPLLAVGGAEPYRWVAVRPLPGGLTLRSDGRLVGAPLLAGSDVLTVQVTDAAGARATADVDLRVVDPSQRVVITQSPLPTAAVAVEYCTPEPIRLFASGGAPPYRWTVLDGSPGGLALSTEGELCGVPSAAGKFTFVVAVEDATGSVDTSGFTLEVGVDGGVTVATMTLVDATLATPYEASLRALRGTAPLRWSIVIGDLPPGITLAEDGLLSGTPTELGTSAFVVQVEDAAGTASRAPLSIRVVDVVVEGDSGCSCQSERAAPGGSWWSVLLVGLVFLRRRGAA